MVRKFAAKNKVEKRDLLKRKKRFPKNLLKLLLFTTLGAASVISLMDYSRLPGQGRPRSKHPVDVHGRAISSDAVFKKVEGTQFKHKHKHGFIRQVQCTTSKRATIRKAFFNVHY